MASIRKTYEVFGYRVYSVTKTTHKDPVLTVEEEIEELSEEQLLRLGTSDHSFGFTDYDPVFSERYWIGDDEE